MKEKDLSVATLMDRIKAGDDAAAAEIFNRFARRLLALARSRLDTRIRRRVDAEDVVQSVFRSFFIRQLENEFEVRNADNLWSLLAVITVRKCANVKVHFHRQSRDVRREMRIVAQPDDSGPSWDVLARDPTPAHAAALTDLIEHLLAELPERERQIVSLALEGQSLPEISAAVNRAERTVRRTLEHFRQRLEEVALEHPSAIAADIGSSV
jgi:RNA polymerase sigma-70 factor (ECF subfamily)